MPLDEELDPYSERILAAARRLLLEFGLKRTPLADIARAAGVSEATLYRRFAGRNALLRELVTREVRAFIAQMDEHASAIDDPAEALAAGFVFFMRALTRQELGSRLIQTDPEAVLPMLTTGGGPWLAIAREYVAAQMAKAVERHDVEFTGDPDATGRGDGAALSFADPHSGDQPARGRRRQARRLRATGARADGAERRGCDAMTGLTRREALRLAGLAGAAASLRLPGSAFAASNTITFDDGSTTVPGGVTGDPGRVVIIGAGWAGLTLANALRTAGVDHVVLEARDRVGGRANTVDLGGHTDRRRLLVDPPALRQPDEPLGAQGRRKGAQRRRRAGLPDHPLLRRGRPR